MKRFVLLHFCFLLLFLCETGHAESILVGEIYNFEKGTVDCYYGELKQVNKTSKWRLGRDKDLLSMKELVEIARSRVKLSDGYRMKSVQEVRWLTFIPTDWIVRVTFLCVPKDVPGHLIPKDGWAYVDIFMLPDGSPLEERTRKVTPEELGMPSDDKSQEQKNKGDAKKSGAKE